MKKIHLGVLDEIKKLMEDKIASKLDKPRALAVEIEAKATPKEEMQEEMNEENPSKIPPHDEIVGGPPKEMDPFKLNPQEKDELIRMYQQMHGK